MGEGRRGKVSIEREDMNLEACWPSYLPTPYDSAGNRDPRLFESASWKREMGGKETMRGQFWLDQSQGLGLLLGRLGLIVRKCEIKQEFGREDDWGVHRDDFLLASFVHSRSRIYLNLNTELREDATLSLVMREGQDFGGIVLHLDYEDSTRELVRECAPVIVEQWKSQNGEFTKKAAALLGMLLMEMLWAAAS